MKSPVKMNISILESFHARGGERLGARDPLFGLHIRSASCSHYSAPIWPRKQTLEDGEHRQKLASAEGELAEAVLGRWTVASAESVVATVPAASLRFLEVWRIYLLVMAMRRYSNRS